MGSDRAGKAQLSERGSGRTNISVDKSPILSSVGFRWTFEPCLFEFWKNPLLILNRTVKTAEGTGTNAWLKTYFINGKARSLGVMTYWFAKDYGNNPRGTEWNDGKDKNFGINTHYGGKSHIQSEHLCHPLTVATVPGTCTLSLSISTV